MDATPFAYDFFLSRRGSVATVAQEVAGVLTAENYRVRVQDYDFAAGGQVAAANGTRRIGLLRCDDDNPSGLLSSATYGDLHNVADPAERRRIILAVARGEAPAAPPTPRIFGGATMPLENKLFTGREAELDALHAALSSGTGRAAVTQAAEHGPLQAALHGLGGIGKTSLARAYVARHGGDYPGGVWWITATDRPGTLAGLATLAHALDPRLPQDMPPEAAAQTALDRLAARQAPFLLVYDNAPDPRVLSGLLPQRGAAVLITSRHPDWATQAHELPIAELPEDDAVALLLRRANRQDAAGARRLARELGCLPLALDQAGAYAKATLTGFDDYARQVEALIATGGSNPDYPASVAATFALAIDQATRTAPAAEHVLARFAWMAPEAIPLLLLDDSVAPAAGRTAALAALSSVSLVTPAPDSAAEPAVTVHRLVQAVMRTRLAEQGTSNTALHQAIARLAAVFPYGYRDAAVWPLCRRLLPHQRALTARVASGDDTAELAALLNLAGSFLEGSGDAAGALPLYRRALESCERVLGKEHPATLTSVGNLAGCLYALGDAAGALPLFRRALDSRERVLGKEHPDTLVSVSTLALCLQAMGDAAAALPLFRRALKTGEHVLGADHPDTLVWLNNLAECMRASGDAAGALPLHRRALDSRERVLGKEHPATLGSVNNLAFCMQALGDAAGALPLYRHALESCERVLGKEHPDTLTSANNLAGCLYALGDAAGALPLFRRALDGFERLLGPEHPSSKTVRANYERCEREVAAAQHGPTRESHASRSGSQPNAAPWWRRWRR